MFSLDMILQNEQPYVLEVNPRVSASYELYERLNPWLNLVDAHIRVCEGVRLSDIHLESLSSHFAGYKIVYADEDILIPSCLDWPQWIKDKPESKKFISSGEPICSVYSGVHATDGKVKDQLEKRKGSLLIQLKQ